MDDEKDLLVDDPNADTEDSKVEASTLEKIIEEKHSNYGKISRHYKLFEYIAKSDPDQILRYIKDRTPSVTPLWMSERVTQIRSLPAPDVAVPDFLSSKSCRNSSTS